MPLDYQPAPSPSRNPPLSRGPALFWLAALATTSLESAIATYLFNDYNTYLARDGTLLITIIFSFIFFAGAFLVLTLLLAAAKYLKPTLTIRTTIPFWITMGALSALAATLPRSIDALTWTHHIDSGGNLESQGWGDQLSSACSLAALILTLILSFFPPHKPVRKDPSSHH